MIIPKQHGAALIRDIQSARPEPGEVAIWWLGQSGYALKTASALIYVDLYLSEHLTTKYAQTEKPHIRMTEAPLRGHEITNATWIFASHKHSDHLDPGTLPALFAASPTACLIVPAPIIDHAVELGLDRARLIATRGDETLHIGPLTVHSLPSAHPAFDFVPEVGYPFQGFVFEIDGLTLYHSGDTLVYPGLAERLKRFALDIAFLPINGTDARREALHVPPNMNAEEAIALARQMNVHTVIPHHYDMFTFNTADVRDFARMAEAAHVRYAILQCGVPFRWRRGA